MVACVVCAAGCLIRCVATIIGETATLLSLLCGIIDRHEGPLICSEVFTGHAANNKLRKFVKKFSTGLSGLSYNLHLT